MSKNKLVMLNATPLVMGGALQSCVSFIRQSLEANDGIDWYYLVSNEISEQLIKFNINIMDYNAAVITPSPSKSKLSRKKIIEYERQLNPDFVFTFFGPAYVNFSRPHLMGVADGWITHASWLALKSKNGIREKLRFFSLFILKRHWYKKADRWVVEAECARVGMENRLGISKKSIAVVANNCADIYRDNIEHSSKSRDTVRIFTLSAYYKHKNLEIIPLVAAELRKKAPDQKFEFILTINKGEGLSNIQRSAKKLGVSHYIKNIGPVSLVDGPAAYANADIVFMPTLLETFSAVYPEAMSSGCAIITTDLSFARDICGEAACYYSPLNAEHAADEILKVAGNREYFMKLVEAGRKRVKNFPSQSERYQLYIEELKELQRSLNI